MLAYSPRIGSRQIIQPTGNVAVTSVAGANGTLASFSIPAGTMRANSQLVIYCDLTCSVIGQTLSLVLNDGSATTILAGLVNNTTTTRVMFRVANRNSTSAQYSAIENVINFTVAGTPQNTTTKALAGAFTLSLTTTNAGGDVTLQSVLLEVFP